MPKKNYYQTLQVDPSADPEIIHAAYKRLALKYHPDTNPTSQSTRTMQEINEAYQVLSDPATRSRYDQALTHKATTRQTEEQPSSQQPPSDRVRITNMILNFISATMLLSVLAGYISRKIGISELLIILALAVILALPRLRQLQKQSRRRK